MGKIRSNLKFLFILGIVSVLISYTGCNDDDENSKESLLIGVWTITDADIDATIGGMSIVDYLVNIEGYSQVQAEAMAALFQAMLLPNFTGTIEFKENHTYVTTFGGDVDDGTWSLNSAGDKITLDAGTIYEMVIDIVSLTASTLVANTDVIESVDIDDDMIPDVDVSIYVQLTFTK
jgi:hypothetical protein